MICIIHGYFEGWCDLCQTRSEVVSEEVVTNDCEDDE